DNFDGKEKEPSVLPSLFPNLLVNGATGIAVGMATNIPTHNLSECIDGCIAYIDNPDIDVAGLMQHIPAPDFPTGAYIYGMQGVRDAYETGRGRIIMRAKAEIEPGEQHDKIIVSEIPYGVNKAELIKAVADLVNEHKIEGISNANDESDREGMRIVIDVKRDFNANVVLNKLYKMTQLQTSFSVNSIALVGGRPKLMTLRDMIKCFVDHRHEVTIRRTEYDKRKAEERAHILQGLIIASDNIDEVVHIIRASRTPEEARTRLQERFSLDELQSKAIVDMRLAQLTGLQQDKLHAEFDELMEKIAYYNQILTDEALCWKVIKDELLAVKEQFGDARRSEIVYSSEEFNPEDFYADDEIVITISHLGYIKRTPLAEFRTQGRGGVGSKGSSTRDADFIEYIYRATMHNTMLFFTKKGRCYWLKAYDIPEGNKASKGRAIQNMLNIEPDDAVNACLYVRKLNDPEFNASHNVIFCTKNGTVKKTSLADYSRPRTNGVIAINIAEGDRVVDVALTNGNNEIVIASKMGRAVRFNETAVRTMGRVSTGVRGITLEGEGNEVVGMVVVDKPEDETILVVSEKGYGKRSDVSDYRITNRGGKGVKTLEVTEKTGLLTAIKSVTNDEDLMIINKSGITLRLKLEKIKIQGRATQGVKLIELQKRNDTIANICVVPSEDNEDELPDEARAAEIPEPTQMSDGQTITLDRDEQK
ncbi:MAG: DNA gyrase subunit A, partial [Bacteroidaceae bacterium]|nr:DNA gyrase subunit A [Bacteroidaceae bacterium]